MDLMYILFCNSRLILMHLTFMSGRQDLDLDHCILSHTVSISFGIDQLACHIISLCKATGLSTSWTSLH